MRDPTILVALMAAGCAAPFPSRTFLDDPNDDYDRDIVTEASGDCDDANPGVQDRVWYEDRDGDGYGGALVATSACVAPAGAVSTAGDCDDDRADVHPGAAETCDLVDSNCDGDTDTHLVSVVRGDSHATITDALGALPRRGERTVHICPGTYEESLDLPDDVALVALAGPDVTRIAWGGGSALTNYNISHWDDDDVPGGRIRFEGLTLGDLFVADADVEIEDCVVADGHGVAVGGGNLDVRSTEVARHDTVGLSVSSGAMTLAGVLVHHNIAGTTGVTPGGISVYDGTLRIEGEVIVRQNATIYSGGGIGLVNATMQSSQGYLLVEFNEALGGGGGLYLDNATARGAWIASNQATLVGGGVRMVGDSALRDATVYANVAARGGGLYVESGSADVAGCDVTRNVATLDGGNIYVRGAALTFEATEPFGGAVSAGQALGFASDLAVEAGAEATLRTEAFANTPTLRSENNACVLDPVTREPLVLGDGTPACTTLWDVTRVTCEDRMGCSGS